MPSDDQKKALRRKYEEEALDRKAKAGIQANNYNCSVRMFKNFIKKESSIQQVTCQKCGKVFKTNRDTNLCFKCEKR